MSNAPIFLPTPPPRQQKHFILILRWQRWDRETPPPTPHPQTPDFLQTSFQPSEATWRVQRWFNLLERRKFSWRMLDLSCRRGKTSKIYFSSMIWFFQHFYRRSTVLFVGKWWCHTCTWWKMSTVLSEYVGAPLKITLRPELLKQHCCSAGGGDAEQGKHSRLPEFRLLPSSCAAPIPELLSPVAILMQ